MRITSCRPVPAFVLVAAILVLAVGNPADGQEATQSAPAALTTSSGPRPTGMVAITP